MSATPEAEPRSARIRAAAVLAVTLVIVAALGLTGLGVEGRLQPTSLAIGGTSSAKGEALAERHFGASSPFAVLLRGPAGAIERQGPRVAAALRRELPALTVISPWDGAAAARKLPAPPPGTPADERSRALLLLDFHQPLDQAMQHTVPELEDTLAAHVQPPLEATQSGYATISRALQHESLSAAERAELLAAPLLLLVLLLVFRSVLAALIPLAFGAATVFAGRGVLVFLTSLMPIDALSLVVCTMMGLALGVDYSLLIVSRFREELAAGHDPARAAALTRRSAGRTTAIAGATLFFSIFLSAFFQPGSLLVSLAAALATVTALAVLIAWASLPALLTLLGPRINAGRIGRSRPGGRSRVAAAASRALRRPAVAAVAIALPLLALGAPALAFDTGSPGVDELSPSSDARQDSEAIAAAVGAGWQAPFILTVAARRGTIASRHRLGFLASTQRRIESLPGVKAVVGPAAIARTAGPLHILGSELEPSSTKLLTRLGPRLHEASAGVGKLRGGLTEAAAGGSLLGEGSARAGEGAQRLAGGLGEASAGGDRASGALERLASGSGRLAEGQKDASATAYNLSLGLRTLLPNLTAQGVGRARRLAARLEKEAASDRGSAPAAHEAAVLASVLATDREELARLREQAAALEGGLERLYAGGRRLHGGSVRLAEEAARLSRGLRELDTGAQRLAGGLGELHGGAAALSTGLAAGSQRAYPLQQDLGRAGRRVSRVADPLARRLAHLHEVSPRLFDSGFLAIAAIDGADPVRRSLAAEVIDVDGGGSAARYLIVPRAGFNTPGSRRLGSQLDSLAAEIDARRGYRAGVSGGAAVLNDYGSATKSRLPLVVGSIVLITFLMLVALLRAPLLAALAVGLNLLSVAAAIGVVTLACKIPSGYPLGGHSYIDTVGAAAIFGVTFGLSIDYAVFLLARMHESFRSAGDNRAAIRFGLDRTAGVITGAAAIMAAVFASFAIAPVATVSQMGLGLTVAILLDATVVRIVLLPALMLLIGDRVWRTPGWLDRLLPNPSRRPTPQAAEAAG
ncbi:MAG TPA: MMPL family transporter [Solirubrobacterales bacterium]|nr:MMPL family transporter [Solirubrobacterales bacterium]